MSSGDVKAHAHKHSLTIGHWYDQLDVTHMTVLGALDLLRAEGLIVSRQGSGVFVRTPPETQPEGPVRTIRELRRLHYPHRRRDGTALRGVPRRAWAADIVAVRDRGSPTRSIGIVTANPAATVVDSMAVVDQE